MRLFLRTLSVVMLCGILSCPMIEARGRNNGGGNEPQRTQQNRGNQNSRGTQNNRGTQQRASQNNNQRPGQNNNQRPGQNNNQRPGQNNNQRPNNGTNHNGSQPGNNKPNNGGNHNGGGHNGGDKWHYGNPGYRPGNDHYHGVHYGVPPRPWLPAPRPYAVPRPPHGWVYNGGGPLINTILGITIGTALNTTINILLNNGYNVTGYVDNAIYVADAMQLNMLWPNATLYYGPYGGLIGSEFYYSSPYYDMNRYNLAYNRLYNAFGPPVSSVNLAGGGIQTTWWGANGAYVQLQFQGGIASNGSSRFYTTLSFGN